MFFFFLGKPFQGQQDVICISQALFALFAFCSLYYATQKNIWTLTHIFCKSNINAMPSEQVFYEREFKCITCYNSE